MVFQNKLAKILPIAAIFTTISMTTGLTHAEEHDPHNPRENENRRSPARLRNKDYREPYEPLHEAPITLLYNPNQ